MKMGFADVDFHPNNIWIFWMHLDDFHFLPAYLKNVIGTCLATILSHKRFSDSNTWNLNLEVSNTSAAAHTMSFHSRSALGHPVGKKSLHVKLSRLAGHVTLSKL